MDALRIQRDARKTDVHFAFMNLQMDERSAINLDFYVVPLTPPIQNQDPNSFLANLLKAVVFKMAK